MMSLRDLNYALTAIVVFLGFSAVVLAYSAMNNPVAPFEQRVITENKIFKMWRYECLEDHDDAQKCIVFQDVTDDNGTVVLRAEVSLVERGQQVLPRLQIVVPLGVFLPAGISVHLASQEPFTVPFQYCRNEGCFINLDLADDVVQVLAQSKVLDISYRQETREIAKYSIALPEFSEALSYLIARS